jgi:hypothetical protein
MERLSKIKFSDEFKQAVSERLNEKTLLMNPLTGTVQSLELWQTEKDSEHPEVFIEDELVEVKLVNEKWVRVS